MPPRKVALQDLAADLGMTIHVCHFPPGTSKGNKIEHRMFCHRDSEDGYATSALRSITLAARCRG
jgi:hypothetical protein